MSICDVLQANLCLPQHSVNFDLTHKRGEIFLLKHVVDLKHLVAVKRFFLEVQGGFLTALPSK